VSNGYVYILRCADGTFYVGSTRSVEARVYQHSCGQGAEYTKRRLPVELVYVEEFDRIDDAFGREKQLQGWSHAKRAALVEGKWATLRALSRGRDRDR